MSSPIVENLLIIEDGSIVENANAYINETYADSYHTQRGNAAWGAATPTQKQTAIIRATQSIDMLYKSLWLGSLVDSSKQSLEFPRKGLFTIRDDEIPTALKKAVAEAALRELNEPNSIMPDLERGGKIKRVRAGSVEVEYSSRAEAATVYAMFNSLLVGLIAANPNSSVNIFNVALGG